jgi:hypothetical protein
MTSIRSSRLEGSDRDVTMVGSNAPPSPQDHYSRFDSRLLQLRRAYLSEVDRFVPDLRHLIHLPSEYLFGEGRFLGEYYCLWLADTLGLTDDRIVCELGVATVFARAHSVLIDYIADHHQKPIPNAAYLSAIFLERSIARFVSAVGDTRILDHISSYLRQSLACDQHERGRHWGRVIPYAPEDMITIASKTSLCFLPAVALCLVADRHDCLDPLVRVVQARNAAIQIRDDVADWQRDLAVENFTMPLTLVLQILGYSSWDETKARHLSEPTIFRQLVHRGFIDNLLALSNAYVNNGSKYLSCFATSPIKGYLAALEESNNTARRSLSRIHAEFAPSALPSIVLHRTESDWPIPLVAERFCPETNSVPDPIA